MGDVEVALAEGLSHGAGDFGFGQNHARTVFGDGGFHLLLAGDGEGAALFGLGAGDAGVGFGLVGLQASADVLADVDVGDVDRDDLKRRVGV